MITFTQARNIVARTTQRPVVDYGWENADVFWIVMAIPGIDEPDRLVDKKTGDIREIYGMLGEDPAPNLRPIGKIPKI